MQFGIMPTLTSLCFILVLILIYFSKEQSNHISNKVFKLFLYWSVFFAVFQLAYVIIIRNVDIRWLQYLTWRLHWVFGAGCWGILYFYSMIIIYNIKVDTIKELAMYNLQTKIMTVFYLIAPVTLLLPMFKIDFFNSEEIVFCTDTIGYILMGYCGATLFLVLLNMLRNNKNITSTCRFTIWFLIANGLVFVSLQIIFPHVAFFILSCAVFAYILYFCYANPDIEIMEEINRAQVDIEKSSKTKTDFLSNMTYEIKTPLNIISNLCENLENMDEFNEEEAKKAVTQITISGNNLLDIVNNVLDISKIETGRSVLMEKEYRIKDIIDDAVDVANTKIGAKPVKLALQIDQNISSVLYGDSSKLYQAVLNIITNAAKYTEVGKISFTVTSTKGSGEETLLFKVTDTGPGIKEEDQTKLFEKGTRLDTAREGEIEGSGLGLLISKQYIDALGGKIWFTSEYRVGTTFYIEVTQKIVDDTPLSISSAKDNNSKKGERIDCSKYTVLVVDDNKPNIKVIKRLLEKYKFTVQSVQSGQECIFKIKSEEHFDMIFLDHVMPDMDGIEALHVLKGLDGYKLPPIVALTANAISGMKETYLNEGFDEYLSKPINISELDRVINKYFNK